MEDTREMLYAEALVEALRHQLATDDRVQIMGLYFLGLTPHRKMVAELRDEYLDRFYYPPIAELGYVGTAIGAAIAGLRPIVDIATASFMFEAFPQIVNEAANTYYMSGGRTTVPMIFHFNHGVRGGGAAQHSHSPQAMLWNTPGLEIMAPSTPRDVKGLVKTAATSRQPRSSSSRASTQRWSILAPCPRWMRPQSLNRLPKRAGSLWSTNVIVAVELLPRSCRWSPKTPSAICRQRRSG